MQNVQNTQNIDMQKSKISESELSINSGTCLGHLVLFNVYFTGMFNSQVRPPKKTALWK